MAIACKATQQPMDGKHHTNTNIVIALKYGQNINLKHFCHIPKHSTLSPLDHQ